MSNSKIILPPGSVPVVGEAKYAEVQLTQGDGTRIKLPQVAVAIISEAAAFTIAQALKRLIDGESPELPVIEGTAVEEAVVAA